MSATATIDDVLAGRARWCVVEGDCRDAIGALPPTVRIATDPPYDFGHYATDDASGADVMPLLARFESLAIFGYAQTLAEWLPRLGRMPNEWVVWWPTNHAAKAGGRWGGLPRWAEHIAIFGAVHAERLTRERTRAGLRAEGDARMGDVWTDPAPGIAFNYATRLHPNEKPVDLMLRLVTLMTEPDDIVGDTFCGSGTTGVAALRLGRRCILIEREPRYAAVARERLTAEEQGSTLRAARAGQLPLLGGVK